MSDSSACPQERTPQSEGSPGVVANEETLARYIVSPPVYVKGGRITAKFIRRSELKGGCSFDRTAYCPDVHKQGEAHAQKSNKEYVGYCSVNVGSIRSIARHDEQQAFCIIDDAIAGNIAHALIVFSASNLSGSEARGLRESLLSLLTIHHALVGL